MLEDKQLLRQGERLYVAIEDAFHMVEEMVTLDHSDTGRIGRIALESLAGANGFTYVATESIGSWISDAFNKIVEAIKTFFKWIKSFFVSASEGVEEARTEEAFKKSELVATRADQLHAVPVEKTMEEAFKIIEAAIVETANADGFDSTSGTSPVEAVKKAGFSFKSKFGSVKLAVSSIFPKAPAPATIANKVNEATLKELNNTWAGPKHETVDLNYFAKKYDFFKLMNTELEKIVKANLEFHKAIKKNLDKVENSTDPNDFEHFKKEMVNGVGSDAARNRDSTIAGLKALGFVDSKVVQWVKIPQDGGQTDEYFVSPITVDGQYLLAHLKNGSLINTAVRTLDKQHQVDSTFVVLSPKEVSRLNKLRTGGMLINKIKSSLDEAETNMISLLATYGQNLKRLTNRGSPSDQEKAKLMVTVSKNMLAEIKGLTEIVTHGFSIQQRMDRKILAYYKLCELTWVIKD